MINLMPQEITRDRKYGRKNILLFRWLMQTAIAFVLLCLSVFIGLGVLHRSQDSVYKNKQSLLSKISEEKLDDTQKSYKEFSDNLNTVTQILSKQILYSLLLQKIGSVIPPGTTLNSISIASTDNALDLNFNINNSSLAPIIQINLQDERNKLFEKADIIQVTCQQTDEKCTAQLKAQYKKDAVFLFINTIGDKK